MIPWYLFPPPDATCIATHDTAGWTITAHPTIHPRTGAPCQVIEMPDTTPDENGCALSITGYPPFHGVLYLHLSGGAGLVVDIFPKPLAAFTPLPRLVAHGTVFAQDTP